MYFPYPFKSRDFHYTNIVITLSSLSRHMIYTQHYTKLDTLDFEIAAKRISN